MTDEEAQTQAATAEALMRRLFAAFQEWAAEQNESGLVDGQTVLLAAAGLGGELIASAPEGRLRNIAHIGFHASVGRQIKKRIGHTVLEGVTVQWPSLERH